MRPQLGRDFTAEEDRPGNQRVVILTEPLWRRRFHSDPGVLNKTIMLDGTPHQVIGVLPASFHFPRPDAIAIGPGTVLPAVELFRPLALDRSKLTGEGDFNYTVIGRLKAGVSREQAISELNVVQMALAREGDPSGGFQLRADVTSMQDRIVSGSRRGLLVLLASIGVVLLIVCVNLGNLMLARATARGREMAVRAALGASSWRMIRQVLTESLAIALAGGALGMLLAYAAVRGLVAWAPVDVPRLDEVHLDWRAVLFAFGASALAGVLFGLIPAWRASRSEPQDALRSGGRSATEGRHGLRISELLVSAEVALSAALLVGAGLLIGSLVRVLSIDQGFHADNVLTATLNLSSVKYREDKATNEMLERLTAAVQRLPGVKNAAIITALPLQGETWVDMITREDDHRPVFQRPAANYRFASPDYFTAMGIPIVRGRTFRKGEKNAVIISAGTAARIWPGENAVGKHMRRGSDEEPLWEVIGVVADTRAEMQSTPPLMVYRPYQQVSNSVFSLVVRSAQDPKSLAGAVRSVIWSIDRDVPVPQMKTMRQVITASVAQRRFQTMLLAGFAVAALLLAVIGIYGVISYAVNRRRNEIGIRMALGADAGNVSRMVLGQGMRPVVIGLVVGLAAALALGRLLGSLLFEMQASNPVVLASVALVLGSAAALACYVPARRATSVDPADVLRYD